MKKINDNLYLFHYDIYNANCFVIITKSRIFAVDTYFGGKLISDMLGFISEMRKDRELIVVNTHSHYDHIWGNCLFDSCRIAAHEKCLSHMKEDACKILEGYKKTNPEWITGQIEIKYPDTVFSDRLIFYDDDISVRLEALPGHSDDGIIAVIEPLNICIAGDSAEDPFPLICAKSGDIDVFTENLKKLKDRHFSAVYPGHGENCSPTLIDENILYLEKLKEADKNAISDISFFLPKDTKLNSFYREAHAENISITSKK